MSTTRREMQHTSTADIIARYDDTLAWLESLDLRPERGRLATARTDLENVRSAAETGDWGSLGRDGRLWRAVHTTPAAKQYACQAA